MSYELKILLIIHYLLLITYYLLLIINRFGACEKCGEGGAPSGDKGRGGMARLKS
jgi:hypothetical protein